MTFRPSVDGVEGPVARPQQRGHEWGWTLVELLLALTIFGVLTALATPKLHQFVDKARVAKAIGDIKAIQTSLDGLDSLPATLAEIGYPDFRDPWGNLYQYLRFGPKGAPGRARKSRFLVPLNSTYDLYSMGKDGSSSPPITAKSSKDDIIRANDGGFVGLATNY